MLRINDEKVEGFEGADCLLLEKLIYISA